MLNLSHCPECGAPLPSNLPKGLCSRCALIGALVLSAEETGTGLPQITKATSSPQLSDIRHFGDYELLEEIARGGMGIVYKARQVSLDRTVAVKLLLSGEHASEEFIRRFRIEASAAASLRHPHIVAIHEVGVHQGQHYFAMDFVDGPDLARLVREQPLAARRAAGYVKIIAEAIHFAHTRRILHRDLKPSNVLIDSNDQPRVTDFGLAKNLATDSDLTRTGHVMGSPSFMPPEQALGKHGKMGPASDVYSLGAILYHALTGRPPFVGETLSATLQQVESKEPVAPRLLVPGVPADLETICLKCLEKEPARRFESAQELSDELGRFLRDEPIQSRPVSAPEKIWRWCRRQPAVAGLAATLIMFLAVVAVGAGLAAIRFARLNREVSLHLRDSLMTQAREVRRSGRPGQRFESLDTLKQALALNNSADFRARARDEAIAILALPDLRFVAATNLPQGSDDWKRTLFDSRLELCALSNERGEVRVLRVVDGSELLVVHTTLPQAPDVLSFSPNARYLALRQTQQLTVCDLNTRSNFVIPRCWPGFSSFNFAGAAFSSDSQRLVIGDPDDGIAIHELPGGIQVARWQLPAPRQRALTGWAFAFSPDDRTLACASERESGVVLRDAATGVVRLSLAHEGLIRSLAWSADGRLIAGGDVDGAVVIWETTKGERRRKFEGHLACPHDLTFNHAGSVLATAGLDNTIRFWDLVQGRPLFEIESWVTRIRFTADDNRLGLVQQDLRPGWIEWSASEALWIRRRENIDDWAPALSFDARGELVASSSETGLTFWDTRTGRDVGPLVFGRAFGLFSGRIGKEFFVTDRTGVWRLSLTNSGGGDVKVAQRESVLAGVGWQDATLTRDGKKLVALNREREEVTLKSMEDGQVLRLLRGRHFDSAVASSDGRFVFTSQWRPVRAEVWDADTGVLLTELPVGANWRGAFSPDGRWLATFSSGCQLWETGTWRPGPAVPLTASNQLDTSQGVPLGGGAAFSPDGQLLAVVQNLREVRLFALPEVRVVATLPANGGARLQTLSFSGDGSMLAAATSRGEIHLWNLRRLRARLGELHLDW